MNATAPKPRAVASVDDFAASIAALANALDARTVQMREMRERVEAATDEEFAANGSLPIWSAMVLALRRVQQAVALAERTLPTLAAEVEEYRKLLARRCAAARGVSG